ERQRAEVDRLAGLVQRLVGGQVRDVQGAGQLQRLAQGAARPGVALGGDLQEQLAAGRQRQVGRQLQLPGAGGAGELFLVDDLVLLVLDADRQRGRGGPVAAVHGLYAVLVGRPRL